MFKLMVVRAVHVKTAFRHFRLLGFVCK